MWMVKWNMRLSVTMWKEILDGFTAPIDKVDIGAFKKALSDFISDIDQQEEK